MSTDHLLRRLRPLLADRYRFETYLGRGGSASVYTVTNLRLNRREAFKVLAESQQGNEEFTERFANEARLAASLDHPNIVKVYDFGDNDGICWFSMQLIEGPSLSSELHARGPFDPASAGQLFLPLLDALHFSHERGIVHRDVKPSNIIIDPSGRPYLMDFGIAKSSESLLETRTGLILGTPAYVAPEQASGAEIDGRADVYAVGVTMYLVLCGQYPFTADSPLQALVMRMSEDPEPLREKLPTVDPRLHNIVMKALARDPDLRYQSAHELKHELEELLPDLGPAQVVEPRSNGPGPGQPLVFEHTDDVNARTTRASTSRSEARMLRRVRLKRWVRRATVISGTTAGIVLATLFILGPWNNRDEPAPPGATTASQARAVEAPTPLPSTPRVEPTQGVQAIATTGQRPPEPTPPDVRPTAPPPTPTRRPYLQPVEMPRPVSDPHATLDPGLREACLGETIRLSFYVDEEGRIENPRVLSENHPPGCAEYAQASVMLWRYEPARDIEGTAVRAPVAVAFEISEVENDS